MYPVMITAQVHTQPEGAKSSLATEDGHCTLLLSSQGVFRSICNSQINTKKKRPNLSI